MNVLDVSAEAQVIRVLARLKKGPVDTLTLRSQENILSPAVAVRTLRQRGYAIDTIQHDLRDDYGRLHPRIALYKLVSCPAVAA